MLTAKAGSALASQKVRPTMATTMQNVSRRSSAGTTIPRVLRQQVETIMSESYAFMDSPIFQQKDIERDLFTFETEPALPMTSWYQPTRDDALDNAMQGAPQLMKADEERMMFLRFNYSKLRLGKLQKLVKKSGLTRKRAEEVIEWHRRFEHFREYLVR